MLRLSSMQAQKGIDMTNREKINNMTDEELAFVLMCPYDTLGKSFDEIPCHADGSTTEQVTPQRCMECAVAWLKAQAEE